MYSKRALTRGDIDGAIPDYGVALGEDNILIGMAVFGGNGSNAGFFNSGGAVPAEIGRLIRRRAQPCFRGSGRWCWKG